MGFGSTGVSENSSLFEDCICCERNVFQRIGQGDSIRAAVHGYGAGSWNFTVSRLPTLF